MKTGIGRILLPAALLGVVMCLANPAGAALVTLVEDNGNDVGQQGNLRNRVSFDVQWVNTSSVEFEVTVESRDNQGVLGLASLNLNDSNLSWGSFELELVGATWSGPTLSLITALDAEGLVRSGVSLELDGTGSILTVEFDPELTDRSTLGFGNTAFPLFDPSGDLLINIGGLSAGSTFSLILTPDSDSGSSSTTVPLPGAFALGLTGLGVLAGLRRRRPA